MENFCERHRCNMEMRCPKCGPTATDLQAEVDRLRKEAEHYRELASKLQGDYDKVCESLDIAIRNNALEGK